MAQPNDIQRAQQYATYRLSLDDIKLEEVAQSAGGGLDGARRKGRLLRASGNLPAGERLSVIVFKEGKELTERQVRESRLNADLPSPNASDRELQREPIVQSSEKFKKVCVPPVLKPLLLCSLQCVFY